MASKTLCPQELDGLDDQRRQQKRDENPGQTSRGHHGVDRVHHTQRERHECHHERCKQWNFR